MIFSAIMVFVGFGTLLAQSVATGFPVGNRRAVFSVELDPLPAVSHTHSVGATLRLGSIWMGIKTFEEQLHPSPHGIRLRSGYLLQAFSILYGTDNILYVGVQGGLSLQQVTAGEWKKKAAVRSFEIIPTAGFRWFPFEDGDFYVAPSLGIGYLTLSKKFKVKPTLVVGLRIQHE